MTEHHSKLRKRHLMPNKLQLKTTFIAPAKYVFSTHSALPLTKKDFPPAYSRVAIRSGDTTSIAGELNEYVSRIADEIGLHLKHSKLFNARCVS